MNNHFFTSDLHFGHYNIALHCNRLPWIHENPNYDPNKPYHFKFNNPRAVDIKAHDEALIDNWNSMVGKGDIVSILGDFAFKNHNHYLMAINGKKILIKGNHDKASREVYNNFTEVHDFGCRKKICGYDITLCHYAMRSWASSCHGSICLYGHSHGRMPEFENWFSFDVGVDIWGYAPVPFEVAMEKIRLIKEHIKELEKKNSDGEAQPIGSFNKNPYQRMLEYRARNKKIMQSMNYPIDEKMWPTSSCSNYAQRPDFEQVMEE